MTPLNELVVKGAFALVGAAFGAGAAIWQMRRQARDLNGLGKKQRSMLALQLRSAVLLMHWANGAEQLAGVGRFIERIADHLEGK